METQRAKRLCRRTITHEHENGFKKFFTPKEVQVRKDGNLVKDGSNSYNTSEHESNRSYKKSVNDNVKLNQNFAATVKTKFETVKNLRLTQNQREGRRLTDTISNRVFSCETLAPIKDKSAGLKTSRPNSPSNSFKGYL